MNEGISLSSDESSSPAIQDRLDSWKEIAAYLKREVRTVQRWEKEAGLPVHRHRLKKLGPVYGYKSELDAWLSKGRARIEILEEADSRAVLHGVVSSGAIVTSPPQALLSRYVVLSEVGSGGTGIVYKVQDRETGELVALKVLRPELAADPGLLERFKDELRLARRITQKNVCRIHEFVRAEDCAYISQEFVDGESLRQILNRFGALHVRTSLAIAQQICAGLKEAHAQHVIHRDLKPENVMLDRNGQIKLMDFGIACSSRAVEKEAEGMLGTPAYMAPEQAEGKSVDPRTDIYAVGLIIYEMLTGRQAFTGDTPLEVALKQVRERPSPLRSHDPAIPDQLEKAILRSLEKDPAERFQSVDEFAEELGLGTETTPVLEPAQTAELLAPAPVTGWQRMDWLLLLSGVVGLILFFALSNFIFPYSAYRLKITRAESLSLADSLIRTYAPEWRHYPLTARFEAGFELLALPGLMARIGTPQARDMARTQGHSWSVSGYTAEDPDSAFTSRFPILRFDIQGNLQSLRFPRPPGETTDGSSLLNGNQTLAIKYAEDIFDISLASKTPTPFSYDRTEGMWAIKGDRNSTSEKIAPPEPSAAPFEWIWMESIGRKRSIRLWLSDARLLAAESTDGGKGLEDAVEAWKPNAIPWVSKGAYGIFLLIMIVFFIGRRLYLKRSRSLVIVTLILTLAFAIGMISSPVVGGPSPKGSIGPSNLQDMGWPGLFLACAVFAVIFYGILAVPFYFCSDTSPECLASLDHLAKGEYWFRPTGLSILRGILVGATWLGFFALWLLVLGRWKLASPGELPTNLLTGNPQQAFFTSLALSVSTAIVEPLLLFALPFAAIERLGKRPWLAALAAVLLAMLTGNGLNGTKLVPTVLEFMFAGVQVGFLAWAFWKTDLLSSMVAVYTIEVFALTYPVIQIFGQAERWVQQWSLIPWFLLALCGVFVWSQPHLTTGYRRVAAIFDPL